ncbi:unnamed protein product [Prorocentrum cordatum]|uniref:Rhodanese domain-containing protein n=1 Tax=Prorocentrum cordatum TaxID=2364126 RepID=A0ABN9PL31_9DINO|nr:unnamed protein product [Polarella glacialis]
MARRGGAAALLALALLLAALARQAAFAGAPRGRAPPSARAPDAAAASARRYRSIQSPEAAGLLETGEWAYLDVRRPDEQQAVGVPELPEYGAGLHTVTSHVVPWEEWLPQVESTFPDKGQKLIVGCAAGVRSKAAAQVLEGAGYTSVLELDDGYNGWRASGLPARMP